MFGRKAPNADFQTFMDNVDQEKFKSPSQGSWWQRWSLNRKVIISIIVLLVIIAIAVGVGVGLTLGGSDDDGDAGRDEPAPPSNGTRPAGIWKPAAGTTWNYKLLNAIEDTSVDAEVWDIDLFDNDEGVISSLQSQGKKVVCYFSAGSYEDWRQDKDEFQDSDLGDALDGWEGERWLDTKSDNVRRIMRARLDTAAQKRCDGVEPDNVDAYENDSGLDLLEADAADYVTFLANEAHSRNLSIALKNAGAIVPTIIDLFEFSVQEKCIQYNSCGEFAPFIEANKPVFHVEYPKGDSINNNLVAENTKESICGNSDAAGFSTIIKNMNLDEWIEPCPSNQTYSAK